jgi:4-diphosphocytidyl-2-C-methyl-D-erythritol kinase
VIFFPNCKINLGLHILQKRADGFHDLQTVFYPIPVQDGLEIIRNAWPSAEPIELTCSGLAVDTSPENNICYRACQLLKKDFPGLPPLKIHLHKTIPLGAGLGGGSADGAFTLLLLNRKFNLELTEEQLISYALQLGSDCPFFIINQPCFATGRGEKLERIDLDLSAYRIVLVNPGIPVNTGWAFSQAVPSGGKRSLKEIVALPVAEWRKNLDNDFEKTVFALHPEIKTIKDQLYEQGAVYASMSGSGSTLYALFPKTDLPQFGFPPHYFMKSI